MYDSITLYLYEGTHFELKSDSFFDGWNSKSIVGRYDIKTCFVNSYRKGKKDGKRYYPIIELVELNMGSIKTGKRKVKRIEIQTSLPKSIFGTSKYEIGFDDYGAIVRKLLDNLIAIGVITDAQKIKNAIIAGLAIPKSIIIPSYFGEAGQVVRRLSVFNHKPRSKFRFRQYEEGSKGVSFNFNNNIRGDCGYCKYSEILENGYTFEEEEIKKAVLSGEQRRDIFRFELSFFKKTTLEAVLRRYIPNKKKDFTLNDIFTNGNISQKILLEDFDNIFSSINTLLVGLAEMKDNQLDYLLKCRDLNFDERAEMYYMVNITIKYGINHLWKRLKAEVSYSKFYRLRETANKAVEISKKLSEFGEPTKNLVEFLRGEIADFKIIRPPKEKTGDQLALDIYSKLP